MIIKSCSLCYRFSECMVKDLSVECLGPFRTIEIHKIKVSSYLFSKKRDKRPVVKTFYEKQIELKKSLTCFLFFWYNSVARSEIIPAYLIFRRGIKLCS